MVSKKCRRQSGYVTPNLIIPLKYFEKEGLVLDSYYDEWCNWRDGLRDWYSDFKKIKKINVKVISSFDEDLVNKRISMNLKQKRFVRIRKARKTNLYHVF